ncbi:MAG: DNA mismatch repair protein MutS [Alphaproteobacteria bacterium]|nr:MAG: DNA mismatch repair protein MutS [Alphaproteobacteria bacterium]
MGHNGKDIPLDPTGRHDDDKILWEKVTQSVRRMNPQPAFQTPKQGGALKTGPQKTSWIDRSQSVQAKAKTLPDKTMPADFRLGETSGIDRTSARRMQRGQVPIEDRLDLHGLSKEQAQKEVKAFIGSAVQKNFRHVLIITGKGRDGHGILREKVPEWLKDAPLCYHLNAISYAQPKDGGKGALYIRLKRQREEIK